MEPDDYELEPLVFQGCVVKNDEASLTLQIFPGLNVDVERKNCATVEEATDPVSGATFVRVRLLPDAEVRTTFQPRLARLAGTGRGGIPFTPGGWPEGIREGPVYIDPLSDEGGPSPSARTAPTIGTFRTHSFNLIWGWRRDDVSYHDQVDVPDAVVRSWPGR